MENEQSNQSSESPTTVINNTYTPPLPSVGREILSAFVRLFTIGAGFFVIVFVAFFFYDNAERVSDGACNIAVYPIEGVIYPYESFSEYDLVVTPGAVRSFFSSVEQDPYIKGVLLEINSPGGTPVASEQIAKIIDSSKVPVYGLIGDYGLSGGYLIAASTDQLFASTMSDIGSIGVTMSYIENTEQNLEEGLSFVELTAGDYKEAGNPNRPLTEEEKLMFEKDLRIVHDEFINQIAYYRGSTYDEVKVHADGSSMTGKEAFEVGLIDAIGSREEARKVFAEQLGYDVSEVTFCEYQPPLLY
ncbi:S49 family peptidase [Candidatus Kaiserbacteria bacterium]|nr:S49 family peptidase [Candidatus Kaiserbacteria bacterium]